MSRSEARAVVNRAVDRYLASGGAVTQCPPRFVAPSQASATVNPYRR